MKGPTPEKEDEANIMVAIVLDFQYDQIEQKIHSVAFARAKLCGVYNTSITKFGERMA